MTKPLFLLFSLLLTAAVVVFVGWQALFGITLLSFCTLLFSTGGPPQPALVESMEDIGAPPNLQAAPPVDAYAIEEAIDAAGWYYPLADTVVALSAANETSFGEVEAGAVRVAFNAVPA